MIETVCPHCSAVFGAAAIFVRCDFERCPMKSPKNPNSALEMALLGNPPRTDTTGDETKEGHHG